MSKVKFDYRLCHLIRPLDHYKLARALICSLTRAGQQRTPSSTCDDPNAWPKNMAKPNLVRHCPTTIAFAVIHSKNKKYSKVPFLVPLGPSIPIVVLPGTGLSL